MKNRRWIIPALALVLTVQMPLSAAAASYTTYEDYRSGAAGKEGGETAKRMETEYILIEISSEEDLAQLAENCLLDSWSCDKLVKLTADITLQENTDLSIPDFNGIFEGDGHTITNLRINRRGSATGLFRYVQEHGVVRNLNVEGNVTPEGSRASVGGIAGCNYGTIYNCSFSGHVAGDSEIGGIAGINENSGEIRKCRSSAVVTGNHSAGGITGNNHGILNHCSNSGDVNTYGTEVSYELEDITLENLEDLNSTDNVAAHTDSGGIAGISDGKIYYCFNSGTVGYQHVGYNTGGIVGRLHQGYLQNCTNTGQVLGRKDVGGIVGQMEPFWEIQYLNDKLQELDRETEVFLNLLEATHKDLGSYGSQASALENQLTESLKNASAAGDRLTGTANELWYIYNNELTGISQNLKTLNQEWKDQSEADKNNGNIQDVTVSGGNLLPDINFTKKNDNTNDIEGDIANDIKNQVNDNTVDHGNTGNTEKGESIQITNDLESYLTALRKFGDNAAVHVENMAKASTDRTGGISDHLKVFNNELESAVNYLEQLGDVLEAGTDRTGANVDALIEQARVLRSLMQEIRDDLFSYEGITVEDTSNEAAGLDSGMPGVDQTDTTENITDGNMAGQEEDSQGSGTKTGLTELDNEKNESGNAETENSRNYDTASFQQGKVTLCVNQGKVEADTNVGGIVGQIATEYDFDPEEDITFTGAESFQTEQTIKAVVRDSRNLGDVVGKKDCAGGIVGKAEFGAVISCESYGDVSSSGGSNVGGIAGVSEYAVRSCCSMGTISGKNNVGGIVGRGCDIFYSYAYNTLESTGECFGSIAGSQKKNGVLCKNYYVEGCAGAIDGISYEGGATPLPFEDFCRMEGVPKDFSVFTITFMADGKELASCHCGYGDSLSRDQIPEIPEKEGCYAVWPEFDFTCITGNRVLEAVYEPWIGSLASRETDENGRSLVLAEGRFLPGQELVIKEDENEICLQIVDEKGSVACDGPIEVRVLCSDMQKTKIELQTEGSFRETETKTMGSYLVFSMEKPGTFRVTSVEKDSMMKWYAAGGCAIFVILLFIFLRKLLQRRATGTDEKAETSKKAETDTLAVHEAGIKAETTNEGSPNGLL